ncbi:ribokinase [Mangrovibacter sp. MFB070]|uniref:carbohydrate kinase family protein n=1 Tax=Mangrovibacter sp. MFB070 TaxID=1224318 RepID=UPI0004D91093|nr:carbohydrate kinase family protein [Mangrovibacter sp. MFB070]KEA52275.1 ribokinase [Mangrovibacter sp. MFB070]
MHNLTTPVLYVAGNINVDIIMGTLAQWPLPGTEAMLEHSALRPGGSAGNCALALAAMEIPHRAISCQGNDAFTPWLAGYFPQSAAGWPGYACETSFTVGVTHPDKERSFLSNYGHITRLSADDILQQLPEQAIPGDIVLLCGTFLCSTLFSQYSTLLPALRKRGYRIAVDTGWPPTGWTPELRAGVYTWLPDCDWLLLNEVETLGLSGLENLDDAGAELARQLNGRGGCVAKCGPDGARLWTTQHKQHAPCQPVCVIDTIGAGDSFNAGFLAALCQAQPPDEALYWGNAVAAHAISSSPRSYPDWQALQHHIEEMSHGRG